MLDKKTIIDFSRDIILNFNDSNIYRRAKRHISIKISKQYITQKFFFLFSLLTLISFIYINFFAPLHAYLLTFVLSPLHALPIAFVRLCRSSLIAALSPDRRNRGNRISPGRCIGQQTFLPLAGFPHGQHVIGHLATRVSHQRCDAAQIPNVIASEESHCPATQTGSSGSPNSMNIRDRRRRKVIVYHQINTLKVNTTAHQLRAYQHPDAALPEATHHVVALRLRAIGVYHVHVDAVVDQLREQLLRALLALHEHQHRRLKALTQNVTERHEFAPLAADEQQLLLHHRRHGVSVKKQM